MNHLARAVVSASAFFEFVDDATLDPHDAVKALEDIAHALQGASPEEMEALSDACAAERESYAQAGASSEVLKFFDQFLYNVGLIEAPPDGPARS
ncbi:MAG: hypothetical protein M3P06_09820 [Acidobacteriota bacterium]|nr:hypothetical protein [Acidobacteriota bacterium]